MRSPVLLCVLLLPATLPAAEEFDSFAVTTVMVPMRDGVRLATDVYQPAREGKPVAGKFPVLITRTPYNKNSQNSQRRPAGGFAQHGYVVLVQDVRGRFASEGDFYAFINEGKDGYDAIEWAAVQPWSDGKVGTFGGSYLAWDQYHAAMYRPPHLVAMFAYVGGANFYREYAYPGGAPNLGWPLWILGSAQDTQQAVRNPEAASKLDALIKTNLAAWFREDPRKRAEVFRDFPAHLKMYNDFVANTEFDDYWKQRGFDTSGYYREMKDVPILFVSGWYDYFLAGVLENFTALSRLQKTPKKLIVGSWPHGVGGTQCGDAYFGEPAAFNGDAYVVDWFDHWMKGRPLTMVWQEAVRLFRMGGGSGERTASGKLSHGGEWFTAPAWPPPGAEVTRYFIQAGGDLGLKPPGGQEKPSTFLHDPENPVPTIGGMYANGNRTPGCAQNQVCSLTILGCADTKPLNQRPDVLSFSTPPLESPVEVTGPIWTRLWVASDAPQTDFSAKLVDVYPDGYALMLADGQSRIRPHPGQAQKVAIETGATSNLFAKGHRIRIDISSSNFPRFESSPYKAHNVVYHDAKRPSRVELPIAPAH